MHLEVAAQRAVARRDRSARCRRRSPGGRPTGRRARSRRRARGVAPAARAHRRSRRRPRHIASMLRRVASVTARRATLRRAAAPGVGRASPRPAAPRARRGFGFEVEERERQLQAADAVADRVVDLLEQRGPSAGEPVDHREFPERPRPIERLSASCSQRSSTALVSPGAGHRDATHVVVEVEARVVGEFGRDEPQRRRDDALREAWDRDQRPIDRARAGASRRARGRGS